MVPPKSSISIGFSIINHPFWGTPMFGNTHISIMMLMGVNKWTLERYPAILIPLLPSGHREVSCGKVNTPSISRKKMNNMHKCNGIAGSKESAKNTPCYPGVSLNNIYKTFYLSSGIFLHSYPQKDPQAFSPWTPPPVAMQFARHWQFHALQHHEDLR